MNMIADSSESLPLHTVSESDEDLPTTAVVDKQHPAPPTINGSSKLATEEPMNSADFATPIPEKPNPLEQVPTVRLSHPHNHAQGGETDGIGTSDLTTPSCLRSHEINGPQLGKLGKKIERIVSRTSETDLGDKETIGSTASRQTTVSQTPSNATGGQKEGGAVGRPGLDKRTSTMKRISSAFKRTVSKNQ
jgi:hypothetical protein